MKRGDELRKLPPSRRASSGILERSRRSILARCLRAILDAMIVSRRGPKRKLCQRHKPLWVTLSHLHPMQPSAVLLFSSRSSSFGWLGPGSTLRPIASRAGEGQTMQLCWQPSCWWRLRLPTSNRRLLCCASGCPPATGAFLVAPSVAHRQPARCPGALGAAGRLA